MNILRLDKQKKKIKNETSKVLNRIALFYFHFISFNVNSNCYNLIH